MLQKPVMMRWFLLRLLSALSNVHITSSEGSLYNKREPKYTVTHIFSSKTRYNKLSNKSNCSGGVCYRVSFISITLQTRVPKLPDHSPSSDKTEPDARLARASRPRVSPARLAPTVRAAILSPSLFFSLSRYEHCEVRETKD